MRKLPVPDKNAPALELAGLAAGYNGKVVQRNLDVKIRRASVFAIMGGSGCGKSTVLKSMIGLQPPLAGSYRVEGEDYWGASDARREEIGRRFGVLFQSSALWSSLTIGENVALPLRMFKRMDEPTIKRLVHVKLALVGLEGAIDRLPAELSGGMQKRAGLARALALDPDFLYFDEPSAGLDPVTSRRLDELILNLRDGLGATIVIVSHELLSLFRIADDGVFLDAETHTAIAHGSPRDLRDHCDDPRVVEFMRR